MLGGGGEFPSTTGFVMLSGPPGRGGDRGLKKMRVVMLFVAAVTLPGCGAGVQYAIDEYSGISVVEYEVIDEDAYRIFDKPSANKLMITPSLGRAAGAGMLQGLTFGGADAMDTLGPKPKFEAAALGYLASTGRKCRILDGYIVARPQWEFKYDCSLPPAQVSAPSQQSKR